MKNFRLLLPTLGLLILFSGCGEKPLPDNGQLATRTGNPPIDIGKASAVAVSPPKDSSTKASSLLGIQGDGATFIIQNPDLVVSRIKGIQGGLLLEGKVVETSENQVHLIRNDQTTFRLEQFNVGIDSFVGQNSNRDLYFYNGQIVNFKSGALSKLEVNFDPVTVKRMSGNFLWLSDLNAQLSQVFDTITKRRYNIQSCNVRMIALSSDKALVDDCSNEDYIDMATGQRRVGDPSLGPIRTQSSRSHIVVKDGAIALAQNGSTVSGQGHIFHIDATGKATKLISDSAESTAQLFGTGDYIVYKEMSNIYWLKRGIDKRNRILSGLNIISVDVSGAFVYYLAEKSDGTRVPGIYDLENEKDLSVDAKGNSPNQLELIR